MLKFVGRCVIVMLCLGLALSTAAFAENRVGATTLTPMAGFQLFDGGMDLDDGGSFGLALGYNITPTWAIETDVRFTSTENAAGLDIDVWTFGLSGLYHFQPEQAFNPYLAAGVGGMVYDLDGTSSDDEDFMGYWGGGFKYAMTDNAALRLDLRHILDGRTDNRLRRGDSSTIRHHLSAMLGLSFQFGGASARPVIERIAAPAATAAAVPAQPVDNDGDGVTDRNDKCPETPAGVRVTAEGCPVDSDSDGVFDYLDACPDTPAGTAVDARGCAKPVAKIASLTLNLLFGVDQARVTSAHSAELALAADFIARYPGYDVIVAGHTDDQGSAAYNKELSLRRAVNVRQALIDNYGVAPEQIVAHGHGEIKPVASNASTAGRAQNRRVEINIMSR